MAWRKSLACVVLSHVWASEARRWNAPADLHEPGQEFPRRGWAKRFFVQTAQASVENLKGPLAKHGPALLDDMDKKDFKELEKAQAKARRVGDAVKGLLDKDESHTSRYMADNALEALEKALAKASAFIDAANGNGRLDEEKPSIREYMVEKALEELREAQTTARAVGDAVKSHLDKDWPSIRDDMANNAFKELEKAQTKAKAIVERPRGHLNRNGSISRRDMTKNMLKVLGTATTKASAVGDAVKAQHRQNRAAFGLAKEALADLGKAQMTAYVTVETIRDKFDEELSALLLENFAKQGWTDLEKALAMAKSVGTHSSLLHLLPHDVAEKSIEEVEKAKTRSRAVSDGVKGHLDQDMLADRDDMAKAAVKKLGNGLTAQDTVENLNDNLDKDWSRLRDDVAKKAFDELGKAQMTAQAAVENFRGLRDKDWSALRGDVAKKFAEGLGKAQARAQAIVVRGKTKVEKVARDPGVKLNQIRERFGNQVLDDRKADGDERR